MKTKLRIRRALARFALPFAALAAPAAPAWSASQTKCDGGWYTIEAPGCVCPPDTPCTISLTVVAVGGSVGTANCSGCEWSYVWETTCLPCTQSNNGSGGIDLNCHPYKRSAQDVVIQCPTGGGDWVTVHFTCPQCQ